MSKTKKINMKMINHWLGNQHEEWLPNLIYRLLNNEISSVSIKVEIREMWKDYLIENEEWLIIWFYELGGKLPPFFMMFRYREILVE